MQAELCLGTGLFVLDPRRTLSRYMLVEKVQSMSNCSYTARGTVK